MGLDSTNKEKEFLGYNLNAHQDAIIHHLIPSIAACILYQLVIAVDIGVIFRHYKDGDPIWASLTLFIMYLPALGSFMIIISDLDYWPEPENGFTKENTNWCLRKTLEHLFFPVWNMWRFAERIFWSFEAVRSNDVEGIKDAISMVKEARLIELYVFLQAYLHALPQVILQLHILMRHNSDIARESKNVQVVCIIFNLLKVAVTTTYYQRFKTQKLTGNQYPWLKKSKILRSAGPESVTDSVVLRDSRNRRVIENSKEGLEQISKLYNVEPEVITERRRSSDIYLEPESVQDLQLNLHRSSAQEDNGNQSMTLVSNQANPSFNITRVRYQKGLEEDNLAGRTVALLWWFTFLLSRVLAITVFAYFFTKSCVWLLISHVLLVLLILLYDVKSHSVKRDRAVFFVFLALVYIFCIIEFKIRFKRAYVIYSGYFGLIFLENLTMCLVWYNLKLESLEYDYWFRYAFFITVSSNVLSLSSMIFYHILVKPKSVLLPKT